MKQVIYDILSEGDLIEIIARHYNLPVSAVEIDRYEGSTVFKVEVPYEKVVIDQTDYLVRKG